MYSSMVTTATSHPLTNSSYTWHALDQSPVLDAKAVIIR
jgi:hypothetical protein